MEGKILILVGLALAFAAMVGGSGEKPKPHRYFVAPDGNDAWSGTLLAPNRGERMVPSQRWNGHGMRSES